MNPIDRFKDTIPVNKSTINRQKYYANKSLVKMLV